MAGFPEHEPTTLPSAEPSLDGLYPPEDIPSGMTAVATGVEISDDGLFASPERQSSIISRFADRVRGWTSSLPRGVALPESEAPEDLLGRFAISAPPWLVSMVIHFSLMILLGLIVLRATAPPEPTIEVEIADNEDLRDEIYAETLGEQLDDPSVMASSPGPESEINSSAISDLPPVDDPIAAPPSLNISPDGTRPIGRDNVPIGMALTGRELGMKQALLKAYGGTATTEAAVDAGLKWLASRQLKSGMWSLTGPYSDGARRDNDPAATGMALLAFQGAGHTPNSDAKDPYVRVVRRGWSALLKQMDEEGKFFDAESGNQRLYTQAICTIALCELFGMTGDYQYRDAAQKAIDYCVKIQTAEGGWRYEPGIDSDLSVTGWFTMAMQSARMAGLEVQSPVFEGITKFLDSVARDEGSKYAYRVRDGATLALSAEGLLCRQYLGWAQDDPRLKTGVDYILANLPEWDKRNAYYWYYATQVCHHMEGKSWRTWNDVMRQLLPENQVKRGAERGSWDPEGDRWGPDGGRLYVTCLSLYVLEVYYRHLPMYQTELMKR